MIYSVLESLLAEDGHDIPTAGGSQKMIRCPNPDHDDKNPSCSVNLAEGVYKCFSLPAAHPESTDETNNGVSLCTLHHRAFDRGFVTFDEKYRTYINEERVVEFQDSRLDGGLERFRRDFKPLLLLPPDKRDRPRSDFIEETNRIRGWNASV